MKGILLSIFLSFALSTSMNVFASCGDGGNCGYSDNGCTGNSCDCADPNCGKNPCLDRSTCCEAFGNIGAR